MAERQGRHMALREEPHETDERFEGRRSLTNRHRTSGHHRGRGQTNREIVETLVPTVDTVKTHLTRAMALTRCTNRTRLALAWSRHSQDTGRTRFGAVGSGLEFRYGD